MFSYVASQGAREGLTHSLHSPQPFQASMGSQVEKGSEKDFLKTPNSKKDFISSLSSGFCRD